MTQETKPATLEEAAEKHLNLIGPYRDILVKTEWNKKDIETYLAGARAVLEKMEWISVSDGYPKNCRSVWVFVKDYFDYGHHHQMALGWMGDHWRCGSDAYHGIDVTHWMELPAPPTESDKPTGGGE